MQIVETLTPNSANKTSPKLDGQLDAVGLAQLLTSVDDVPTFQSAIIALQNQTNLSQAQQVQLARAFISLLDATPQQRQQIAAKLQPVSAIRPAGSGTDT